MKTKAQSSLEFLMIFGMGLSIIMIMTGLFFGYFNSEKSTLDARYLEDVGQKIMENTEKIYFLGEGNKVTIETKFPDNIVNISIMHKNQSGFSFDVLNITYIGDRMRNTLLFDTNEPYIRFNCTRCYQNNSINPNISYYNDTSDFTGGSKRIKIESQGEWVSIDFDK